MKKTTFTETQIVSILKQNQSGRSIKDSGNGSPQAIAGNVIQDLVRSKAFQFHNNNILSGHTAKTGNFSVDLTSTDFFVGRTNINYSISIVGGNAIATFTMFVNDGFWDPNYIGEKFIKPDGMGPNLETPGGHPYPFIPVIGTETFPNPGYH